MRPITHQLIDDLIAQAATSPRKRVPYNFHEHDEPVQRMINAIVPGSYVTPHQHGNPPKVELIAVLKGQAAMLHYTPDGAVEAIYIMGEGADSVYGVDIPPGVFHNFVALTPCAVLEIIKGPYEAATHKQFAPWAPAEGSPEAAAYLANLEALIHERTGI